MTTPENITELQPHEVFVFGSNLAGNHGLGAARTAHVQFGARRGVGVGPTGRCYAIATKDRDLRVMPLYRIQGQVETLLKYAENHPDKQFLVTPVGCGLAGYKPSDIAPFFSGAPANVTLPESFKAILNLGDPDNPQAGGSCT